VGELRKLRAISIGTERGEDLKGSHMSLLESAISGNITLREQRMVARYISDIGRVLDEVRRVLIPGGQATFVVADSFVRGATISICKIVSGLAEVVGFRCIEDIERLIPPSARYLPPPKQGGLSSLDKRMRVEHCLTFRAG